MAESITIKALQDASLDAKSLEEVVNGNDAKQVTTRLGETYPSVKKAITQMFENGGLPATPFKTKALMTASALVDGKYAQVTDDTVNNGLYVKEGGAWIKSDYDLLTQAKAEAISDFRANDGAVKYGQDYFTGLGGYNPLGALGASGYEALRHTPRVQVIKGEKVVVKTDLATSGSLRIVFFNSTGAVSKVVKSTAVEPAYTPHEAIADVDGFVSTHCASASSTGCSITVGVGSELFVKTKDAVKQSDVDKKADTTKRIDFKDFELGYVDSVGDDIVSTTYLRSSVYKFSSGTAINLNRHPVGRYQLGYAVSDTEKVVRPASGWVAPLAVPLTITKEKPYIRFFIRKDGGASEIDAAMAESVSDIHMFTSVVYDVDLQDTPVVSESDLSGIGVSSNINSLFRTPSLASGGVVTIIDDDGRDAVYSGLYPFLKANGVPFGAAIVPDRIGKTVSGNIYMTMEELKELAEDVEYFETMSHTWSHQNQTNAALTLTQKENELVKAKQWFSSNGFVNVDGFVYPYGADDDESRRRVQKYYNQAYDYGSGSGVSTFDTINNYLIKRSSWNPTRQDLAFHKAGLDEVVANDGWLVICIHVDSALYWDENTYADLQEFIDYAKSKGAKFMLPRDGFQTFGNIVENDSGFKIQANGKIVGAT